MEMSAVLNNVLELVEVVLDIYVSFTYLYQALRRPIEKIYSLILMRSNI